VRKNNKKWLPEQIKFRRLNLSLLRTCRTINVEGSQVFYGDNEFRFSEINGHMVANLFVRKIYKQHLCWIKALTIPIPFMIVGVVRI
jgi:hypothetical protein